MGKKPSRRLEPIILLSPSASSLLRMTNVKPFLESGIFVPPHSIDSAAASSSQLVSSTAANLLHLSRKLPSIDAQYPFRFILVDSPEQFNPDYWSRLVAVFTTGQTWQFKSYKWPRPADLFRHCLGIHLGWQNEEPPETVKSWGGGVLCVKVDKWNHAQGTNGRWRDREVLERIWAGIEEGMRLRGWTRDGPGGSLAR